MTPDEHYAEAERLLDWADQAQYGQWYMEQLTKAQVHATLALYRKENKPNDSEPVVSSSSNLD